MSRMIIEDALWAKLEPLLPKPKGRHGTNNRLFIESVCWIIRTGAPWRDMPHDYDKWKNTYNRYNRWVKKGYFEEIFKALKKDSDNEWHMIDGSIIRAHQHSAGAIGGQDKQALGRSSGGFSTKIHVKVDALGLPLQVILTAGQVQEITVVKSLLNNEYCEFMLGDRGYDSNDFRDSLANSNIQPVIPGKKSRLIPIEYDHYIYKERNIVERFFNRIKHFRRIATRYDKTASMFMGSLIIVSIILWLK